MTAKVIESLESIKSFNMFEDLALYFIGGTALSYYLNHRISEDIDIISTEPLPYKQIISIISSIGGEKLRDENAVALRMAGLVPYEYMLKFNLDGVKLEFFRASTPLQIRIIMDAKISKYSEASLRILDVKSIAKLKLIALLSRNKSRDLFDFKVILEKNVLSIEEILDITSQTKHKITTLEGLYTFIKKIEEPKDDEVVYLDEDRPINLDFVDIKAETLNTIKNIS
ncbi:MAG: nucleotidyl transferase AbiEii/AbiGii toxin family protein [Epsilonproteobacteria bacterium]|nr:nucleotidyl transferase AbiEii/AbiGii toxin family protein [Campylobacterota bacterium]